MTENTLRRTLILLVAGLLLAFSLGPFLWMLLVSLASSPDALLGGTARFSLANYRDVLSSSSLHFLHCFANSITVSGATALLVSAVACLAAYAVSRLHFPGRTTVPLLILAVSMFPQISAAGYLYRMFSGLGWLNTYTALVLPYVAMTAPLALWINLSYFTQIPADLDRAAQVDGAGRFQTLWRIILPVALPGIAASLLLVFIQSFNEFLFAVMLTIDHRAQTLPVAIALFEGAHGEVPWGNLMAASMLGSLPVLALTLACQKYVVAGLTKGAVKE